MSTEGQNSDQRRHARFELLEYAIVRQQGKLEPVRSVIIDVSLGGLQVRSRNKFAVGEIFTLQIGRMTEEPLVVQAEARYCIPIEDSDLFATGFKCLPTTGGERMEWVDYVHAIFQRQGEQLTG
ncbi:MAG: PilZ domain-containing protein [Fimbriimonadaceae bacterium]|nr:PilZ domain-containing protein [Fimbriimonadaceae bacterium]QYK55930.1 MAG: PilZ domain-containing protein [Fimbriimonadaceae bacterium]